MIRALPGYLVTCSEEFAAGRVQWISGSPSHPAQHGSLGDVEAKHL